jgi:hypothetical protein
MNQFNNNQKSFDATTILRSALVFLLVVILISITTKCFCQSNDSTFVAISAKFTSPIIELKAKERFVTNSLIVKNYKDKAIQFNLEVVFPESWKHIGRKDSLYSLAPGDSIILPVRLIPSINTKNGTTVNVQALLVEEEQSLIADASFTVYRKKEIRWNLSSESGDKIYFPAQDSTVPFNVRVLNEGNEKIDLLVSKKQIGTKIKIKETVEDPQHRDYNELLLDPLQDTTLNFTASINTDRTNVQRIDIENYTPGTLNAETRNTLFFQSILSNNNDVRNFAGSKRLDFIRLSDQATANPFGSATVPLIADLNTFNILGIQPVSMLILRGNTMLSNQAILSYQTQTNFTRYQYYNALSDNLFYRVMYATKRGDIQVGNVSGGISLVPINGRGISGSYFIRPNLRVGAFYVKSNFNNQGDDATAYGGYARYQYKKFGTASLQLGRTLRNTSNTENQFGNLITSIRFLKNQQISFGYGISRNIFKNTNETKVGNSITAGYSGSYLKNKLFTNIRGIAFSKDFGANGLPGANFIHRSGFLPDKKWNIILQNTLSIYDQRVATTTVSAIDTVSNKANYNQIFFNLNHRNSRLTPSAFYNITELNRLRIHSRGLGFDYSVNTGVGGSRFGLSTRAGYSHLPDYTSIKDYFTFQLSAAAQLRTLSFNGRYIYGPQFVNDPNQLNSYFKYPQSIFLSLNKQWLPNNNRVVIQSSANYTYMNQFNRHTAGVFPEAYYFTNNKWRFKLGFGYSITASKQDESVQLYQGENSTNTAQSRQVNQNFFMNAGIRKEFGIPVPKKWSKKSYRTLNFTCFLDANGNKIKDKNEVIVKNVVIKIGTFELISNDNGESKLINMAGGTYPYKVWSLFELNGWYPLVGDSITVGPLDDIFIPFVKGIKLSGNIVIQKDRYSGLQSTADLSRILVTATDSSGKVYQSITDSKGEYTIYVPPGKFDLSMDESILGKSFVVLKNNAEIKLQGVESYNYNFYIIEKKRKVNIKKFGE